MNAFDVAPLRQYRIFGNKVAHHDEAAAAAVKSPEQSGADPVEQFRDAGATFDQLVVVEVVNNDVVRAVGAVAQTARGLTAATGKKRHVGTGYKLALFPGTGVILFAEIGNITLVVL